MPVFSVGAIALADGPANAVGAVRFTCAPDALYVELLRAAPFARGFAPGVFAEEVAFRAPYASVRALVRDRRTLTLAFDPSVITPHNRFALGRFSTDATAELAGAYAARARAKAAALVLPVVAAVTAAIFVPESLASGVVGRSAVAALAAAAVVLAMREVVAWFTWGGPRSDRLRSAFEGELGRRLGLAPAGVHVEVPVDLAALDAEDEQAERGASLPRAIAIAGFLAAACVGAALLFGRTLTLRPQKEPPAAQHLAARSPIAAPTAAAPEDPTPTLPGCTCSHADSPAWDGGLPVVAVVLFPTGGADSGRVAPVVDRRGRGKYDFEVAAINDSAAPVKDVRVTLTFARRNKKKERVGATDRGLFWEGTLPPGHAVKWHVKAPGTEMRFEAAYAGGPATRTLEEAGVEAAPPEAAFELTRSRWRAVRLQGAKLLAHARDPRAVDAIAALRTSATGDEARLIDDLARAAAPLFACEVGLDADASTTRSMASACVFNGAARVEASLVLVDRKSRAIIPVESVIPAHEGVRVTWPSAAPPGPIDVEQRR